MPKNNGKNIFFLKLYFILTIFFNWTFAFKIWNYRKQASLRLPEMIINRKICLLCTCESSVFLTLFLKLYLFFSIPPSCHILSMQSPLEFLPKIWSFGHLVILPFFMLDYLVLSLIWWIENRSFDEKKNRAGGN